MRVNTWHEAIAACEKQGLAYVLITVWQSAGSTPRDAGTKMLITGDSQYDTIGGGHLEYKAIKKGRELLAMGESCQEMESFPLSSKLGQCCGGAVKILYEVMACHHQQVAIFGAGHVAQALVPILAQLPLQISWIDSREGIFGPSTEQKDTEQEHTEQTSINDFSEKARQIAASFSNVKTIADDAPVGVIKALPVGAWIIILTHNHQLDYELVEAALKHKNLNYIGMIGSSTKAKRFQTKLNYRGFSAEQISSLVSPIGELSITGKRPIEVAVSISAQLINILNTKAESKSLSLQTKALKNTSQESQ
jgi:xanthine dehydrogenase accessory factor